MFVKKASFNEIKAKTKLARNKIDLTYSSIYLPHQQKNTANSTVYEVVKLIE